MHPQFTAKRLAIAARVSTADQERYGTSLADQVAKGRLYAQLHEYDVDEDCIYADDESGSLPLRHRPLIQRVLADARAGRFTHIVFHKIDRMARRVKHMLELWDAFEAAGVTVHIIDPGIDASTAMGRAVRNLLATLAELEAELILERTMGGRRRSIAAGATYLPSGKYGYAYQRKGAAGAAGPCVTPHEGQAGIVERIYTRRAAGVSYERVALELAADGVPTARAKGQWSATQVERIVRDPAYRGQGKWGISEFVRTERGTRVRRPRRDGQRPEEVRYPPLVSEELWHAANGVGGRGRAAACRAGVDKYLLNGGMVRCAEHGHAMTGSSDGRTLLRYRCVRRTASGARTSHGVNASALDAAVWQTICERLLHPDYAHAAAARAVREAERELEGAAARRLEIGRRLAQLEGEITWMLTEGARTGAPAGAIGRAMEALAQEQRRLTEEDRALAARVALARQQIPEAGQLSEVLSAFRAAAAGADAQTKRRLLEALSVSVEVRGEDFEIGGVLAPERLRGCCAALEIQSSSRLSSVRRMPFRLAGSLGALYI